MSRHAALLAATLVALLGARAEGADTFRCRQRIVHEGMRSAEVRRLCGAPAAVERYEAPTIVHADASVTVETFELWTYERDWGKFPVQLRIERGVVVAVDLVTGR